MDQAPPQASCDDDDDPFDCGETMECSGSCGGAFQQRQQLHGPGGPHQLAGAAPSPPDAALSSSGAHGSQLWRGQHQHPQQQQEQEEQHAAAAAVNEAGDVPADRLELVRAKALAGCRISASELEARPRQQFPSLPHLRGRAGAGGVMRRTSSHI
jgi:hypothetical protein